MKKKLALSLLLVGVVYLSMPSVDSGTQGVVISELMYHPLSEGDVRDGKGHGLPDAI